MFVDRESNRATEPEYGDGIFKLEASGEREKEKAKEAEEGFRMGRSELTQKHGLDDLRWADRDPYPWRLGLETWTLGCAGSGSGWALPLQNHGGGGQDS